jgi:hypothetical protein
MQKKRGFLITYTLEGLTSAQANKFCRSFYGYTAKSYYGKYSYEKKGFLSTISHVQVVRSAILVNVKDKERVLGFLQAHNLNPVEREVILTKEDQEQLKP